MCSCDRMLSKLQNFVFFCLLVAFLVVTVAADDLMEQWIDISLNEIDVTMNCSTTSGLPADWCYQSSPDTSEFHLIFANNVITDSRYLINRTLPGQYDLIIGRVELNMSGLYQCFEHGHITDPLRAVRLTVVPPAVTYSSTWKTGGHMPLTEDVVETRTEQRPVWLTVLLSTSLSVLLTVLLVISLVVYCKRKNICLGRCNDSERQASDRIERVGRRLLH